MNNFDTFCYTYLKHFQNNVKNNLSDYAFGMDKIPEVYEKMCAAFKRGSYNKDSDSIKMTCKELGIKYTYTEINKYLKG